MVSQGKDSCVQHDGANRTKQIRELNDKLRCERKGGNLFITVGICALGQDIVLSIIDGVTTFDDFSESNDPYGEHDFSSLTINEHRIIWKIDYYDLDLKFASPDPSNPEVTIRVLTIMLEHEY